jgi:SAM-dependent methyltransferase
MSATEWLARAIYRAPRELTRCPACSSPRLDALALHKLPAALDGRRTGLVSGCEDCGLVFVNPSPSEDALAAMYGPDGEWAIGRKDEATAPKREAENIRGSGRWQRIFDPIRSELDVTRPPPGASVLDFGCGRGKFLDVLRVCGWQTFGIEPATDLAFARHRQLHSIPGQPTFDLVIAHHVLEHVTDPLALLAQFASATRPGGYLLVGVPRLDTLPLHRDLSYVISRVHVRSYTAVCMEGLLARAGWQMVAAPSDEVMIAGGRRTSARLRALARLGTETIAVPQRPLDAARRALKAYWEQEAPRSFVESLARVGAVRAAARAMESRRQIKQKLKMVRAMLRSVGAKG